MSKDKKPIIYTFEETMEILKTSKNKLRKLLKSGELKGFKLGSYNWRVDAEDLKKYLNRLKSQ